MKRGDTLAHSAHRAVGPVGRTALLMVLVALATAHPSAQDAEPDVARGTRVIAFVRVNVIAMDRERVEPAQTVLVRGDRIIAIDAADRVSVPEDAVVIAGAGGYLLPGLTDAHVHVTTDMPWARARANFGEAPLYLAYGITTIVNLHGSPAQLDWKRRIARGELLGPTLYTSGEHVNEPRVRTPEEVRREVQAQARDGYDVIKYHELWNTTEGLLTKVGLSRAAYLEMNAAARETGMPIVGHAPVNLGFDALLEARQPLAHVEALFPLYFVPLSSSRGLLAVNAAALLMLLGIALAWTVEAHRRRTGTTNHRARMPRHVRLLSLAVLIAGLVAGAVQLDEHFRSSLPRAALLAVFSVLTAFVAAATLALLAALAGLRRQIHASAPASVQSTLVSAAGAALTLALAFLWVPTAWRQTDRGIEDAATRLRAAGIAVQTTLTARELAAGGGDEWTRATQDPALEYLASDTKRRWRRLPPPKPVPPVIHDVTRRLTLALQRAGVLLVAGSDAMGRPLVAPGSSLHRELDVLRRWGLSPYEAIRTATVHPAVFLGRQDEFGTIAVGKRADLLLVDGNPLEDLRRLRQPLGVMVRGRWLTRERLQELLLALAATP